MLEINDSLVSVIIPAYNHERYIETAILSVLNQTYKNLELIVLNDGSTDSTGQIAGNLAIKYRTIRFESHSNMGAHNTINKGIELARGKYIAVLNSDDIFFKTKIARCMQVVDQHADVQMVVGGIKFIDDLGCIQEQGVSLNWHQRAIKFFENSNLFRLSLLNENFITTTSNMFFTKNLWRKVGGFQNLRYCHDLDFLMASFRSGLCIFDKDESHIMYRVHSSNTIKESISKINIELAAVLAGSLIEDNVKLLGELNKTSINFFDEFLKNKKMSDLLVMMMVVYLNFNGRTSFYEYMSLKKTVDNFSNLIK